VRKFSLDEVTPYPISNLASKLHELVFSRVYKPGIYDSNREDSLETASEVYPQYNDFL
jgi:hypothetical protein